MKNISGTLYFDQVFKQLIRSIAEKEEGFPDPITQVKRQEQQLSFWLQNNKFPILPVTSLIVISNPSTIIKSSSQSHSKLVQKITHAASLVDRIESLERLYKTDVLSTKDIKRMYRLLIKQDLPLNKNICKQFQINLDELIKGVHCPECFALPMKRSNGVWRCPKCESSSKDAHISTLNDYSLLIGKKINNQNVRDFLQISSVSVASKLLNSLDLEKVGEKKNRTYILP